MLAAASRGAKGQHSAPRGGPPRSWTNDDLTKALENVWNKRMTTSQASRVYAIPYNSLLMYVRGKYGKSLKLDVLKQQTPAANDNLNTIGNSRSTPKEKAHLENKKIMKNNNSSSSLMYPPPATPPSLLRQGALEINQRNPGAPGAPALNPFAAFQNQFPGLQEQMGLLGMLPHDSSRIRDLMQNIQREQQQMIANAAAQQNNLTSPNGTPARSVSDSEGKVSSSVAAVAQLAAAVQQQRQLQQLAQHREREDEAAEAEARNNSEEDGGDMMMDGERSEGDEAENEEDDHNKVVEEQTELPKDEEEDKVVQDDVCDNAVPSSGEDEDMEQDKQPSFPVQAAPAMKEISA